MVEGDRFRVRVWVRVMVMVRVIVMVAVTTARTLEKPVPNEKYCHEPDGTDTRNSSSIPSSL